MTMWLSNYPFTAEEFRRLAVYKAAVRAGFYTDAYPSSGPSTESSLASSPPTGCMQGVLGTGRYPDLPSGAEQPHCHFSDSTGELLS
jgi:hypothetical protein